MLGLDTLLRKLGINPFTEAGEEPEDERLQTLRDVDEKQEQKLQQAADELQKPASRRMSEEQFFEMLDSKGGAVDEELDG